MVNNIHKLNEEKRRFKIAGILAFFATAPFFIILCFPILVIPMEAAKSFAPDSTFGSDLAVLAALIIYAFIFHYIFKINYAKKFPEEKQSSTNNRDLPDDFPGI